MQIATFVLIPGAGTDPRVYAATIEALRELGHDGVAPALPLDDPAATPSDHAAAVAAAVPEGEEAMAEVFLHDVEPAVAQANERYSGAPQPGMFNEPWPLEAWPDVPTRVLAPRDDRLFPLEFQRRVARERLGLDLDEMEGGHLPMLSRPRDLAQRLVELAP